MADLALNHGQTFEVEGTTFEVVSVSQNEGTGETLYEICSLADADKRRERNRPEPVEEPSEDAADETAPADEEPQTLLPR